MTTRLNTNSIEWGALSTSGRNALSVPAGTVIWNSDNGRLEYYDGATWRKVADQTTA